MSSDELIEQYLEAEKRLETATGVFKMSEFRYKEEQSKGNQKDLQDRGDELKKVQGDFDMLKQQIRNASDKDQAVRHRVDQTLVAIASIRKALPGNKYGTKIAPDQSTVIRNAIYGKINRMLFLAVGSGYISDPEFHYDLASTFDHSPADQILQRCENDLKTKSFSDFLSLYDLFKKYEKEIQVLFNN